MKKKVNPKKKVVKKKAVKPKKKANKPKELGKVDFEKLQKEIDRKQQKENPQSGKKSISKPKFKRVKVYDNGIEMYLSDNRKISIAQEDDGSFIIETKKVLKAEEPFSAFSPAKVKYMKKWGVKVASCQVNISKEALIAIGMAINEMLKKGVFKSEN
jgi:hypothetical protein